MFRRAFDVSTPVVWARLSAVGVGYGQFAINGRPVSSDVLDPPPTTYDRTVLFRTHDVTALLSVGTNALTAHLGRGFYAARGASVWGWNLAAWHREPAVLAVLEYQDTEGVRHVVVSDESWEVSASPLLSELTYSGEVWDLRRAADPTWEPVVTVPGPAGELRAATMPPIRCFEPIVPVSTTFPSEQMRVYDFGVVLAGRAPSVRSGQSWRTVLTIRYGEFLENGVPFCENVLTAGPAQVDIVTLGVEQNSTDVGGDLHLQRVQIREHRGPGRRNDPCRACRPGSHRRRPHR